MTKRPSKREIRERLNTDVEAFIQSGGELHQIEKGISGIGQQAETPLAFEQKKERTPVDDVLKTIDGKRQQLKDERRLKGRFNNSSATSATHRAKKKIIYDDFGEPLRVVWE